MRVYFSISIIFKFRFFTILLDMWNIFIQMGYEFRLFLPLLDTSIIVGRNIANYTISEEAVLKDISQFLPGSWTHVEWEKRTDEYLNAYSSHIGIKKRGGKSQVELKIQPSNKALDGRVKWIEEWNKYKIKAMKSISSLQELRIYRNDLITLFTREGYGESDLENTLSSSGALIPVQKSRKNLNFGSVDLEICILEISCASNVSKWLSVSVESHNQEDILSFLKRARLSYPSLWISLFSLASNLRSQSDGDDLALLPIISGYPMWVQAVDSAALDPIAKQSLVHDSMSRLSSLESFLADEGKAIN